MNIYVTVLYDSVFKYTLQKRDSGIKLIKILNNTQETNKSNEIIKD